MRYRIVPLALVAISLVVTACASAPPESTRTSSNASAATSSTEPSRSQLLDPGGNFVLCVSNQSFEIDPVDIVIEIDGEQIIDGDFDVGSQHNWRRYVIRLSPGRHTATARSTDGDATLRESFVVSDRRWVVLNYWYYTEATHPVHDGKEGEDRDTSVLAREVFSYERHRHAVARLDAMCDRLVSGLCIRG